MKTQIEKKAKKIAQDFFAKAGLEVDIEISTAEAEKKPKEGLIFEEAPKLFQIDLRVASKEADIFIGPQGKALIDLQSILKKILRKQLKENIFLRVDINQYSAFKERYLVGLAHEEADKAVINKQKVFLPEMPAFERRLIHLALEKRQDVATESDGEEPNRRIVIKPVG